ncbi:SCAN domain-containing protein 3-like [Gastrophryne carolinensis]
MQSVANLPSGQLPTPQRDIRANQYLQKMTPADDVEAFLATFERTATREAWPRESWAGLVAPFLIGEAQKAYYDLEPAAAQDFNKLKAEILARLGVTIAVRAQRVHQWTYNVGKPPRSQMFDLVHLTRKWLQPEVLSAPDVVQRVVMDRYLRALPPALRKWVSHGDPKSADQLVDLVERYSTAEELLSNTQDRTAKVPDAKGYLH